MKFSIVGTKQTCHSYYRSVCVMEVEFVLSLVSLRPRELEREGRLIFTTCVIYSRCLAEFTVVSPPTK